MEGSLIQFIEGSERTKRWRREEHILSFLAGADTFIFSCPWRLEFLVLGHLDFHQCPSCPLVLALWTQTVLQP
jgi:hypothetical protein